MKKFAYSLITGLSFTLLYLVYSHCRFNGFNVNVNNPLAISYPMISTCEIYTSNIVIFICYINYTFRTRRSYSFSIIDGLTSYTRWFSFKPSYVAQEFFSASTDSTSNCFRRLSKHSPTNLAKNTEPLTNLSFVALSQTSGRDSVSNKPSQATIQ